MWGLGSLTVVWLVANFYYARKLTNIFIHPPRYARAADNTPQKYNVPYQDVTLTTQDGLELAAWYTPSQNGSVILVAHGHVAARWNYMHSLFAQQGYGVLSWDFRAHGESKGDTCTLGYYETLDVEAALDYLLAQPNIEHIGAWGGSMGGAATLLAAERRPEIEAVISDSTFTTMPDSIKKRTRIQPLQAFIFLFAEQMTGIQIEDIDPLSAIDALAPRPVLIIYGEADSIVPNDAGALLYAAAGEPRELWSLPEIEHMQVYRTFPEEYTQRVTAFFDHAFQLSE